MRTERPARHAGFPTLRAFLLAVTLLAGLAAAAGPAGAQEVSAGEVRSVLRVGILHPDPQLCRWDEPAQRDLRVLRLAFAVGRGPQSWAAWPWYLGTPEGLAPGNARWLALDTPALWGQPIYALVSGAPDFGADGAGMDKLADWRLAVTGLSPLLAPAPLRTLVQVAAPAPPPHPFLPSRLHAAAALPYRQAVPPGPCRDWPQGVALVAGGVGRAYTLSSGRTEGAAPFELRAYSDADALALDFRRGRLDAVLAEGADLRTGRRPLNAGAGTWGVRRGTQQVLVRFSAAAAEALGPQRRRALSLAMPRAELVGVPGPGAFRPLETFLTPLLPPEAMTPAAVLGRDALRARQVWQEAGDDPGLLRLAVPAHPFLERVAERVRAQWRRTLNAAVMVEAVPVDQYYRHLEAEQPDLRLEVTDLETGTLQDLWLASLPQPDRPADLSGWEAALRERVPYLPVMGNVHFTLVQERLGRDTLARLCPACEPAEELPR